MLAALAGDLRVVVGAGGGFRGGEVAGRAEGRRGQAEEERDGERERRSPRSQSEVIEDGRRDVAQGPLVALAGVLGAAAAEQERAERVVASSEP